MKGADYRPDTIPEARVVEELGGTVQLIPYMEDRSTTSIIEQIQRSGRS